MDRGAWRATVHEVTKSWTRLKWLRIHTCRGRREVQSQRTLLKRGDPDVRLQVRTWQLRSKGDHRSKFFRKIHLTLGHLFCAGVLSGHVRVPQLCSLQLQDLESSYLSQLGLCPPVRWGWGAPWIYTKTVSSSWWCKCPPGCSSQRLSSPPHRCSGAGAEARSQAVPAGRDEDGVGYNLSWSVWEQDQSQPGTHPSSETALPYPSGSCLQLARVWSTVFSSQGVIMQHMRDGTNNSTHK